MTNNSGHFESEPRRTFAVTGAGGFIGNRLCHWLLDNGFDVAAIVRSADQGRSLAERGADVRIADIRDTSTLFDAFRDVSGVFHLAALFNNPDKTWDDYRSVNVQGTLNVLDVARRCGNIRVVHCSTVGVATEAEAPPYSESTPYSPQPDDKYEVTKSEAEQAALAYAAKHGSSLVVIRPAQVYGPGDHSKTKFYRLVRKGVIVSPGSTRKHLIFIDDLCRAFKLAMLSQQADNHVFLIAGNKSISLKRLISIVAHTLGVAEPRIRLPSRPVVFVCGAVETVCNTLGVKPPIFKRSMDFFTRSIECDTSKARSILGFESAVSVVDGVRAKVNWIKQHDLI